MASCNWKFATVYACWKGIVTGSREFRFHSKGHVSIKSWRIWSFNLVFIEYLLEKNLFPLRNLKTAGFQFHFNHFRVTKNRMEASCNRIEKPHECTGWKRTAYCKRLSCSFTLKWLVGTRVSRCYGCGGVIQNPPLNCPDDLVVMYRDIGQFRHKPLGS